MEPANGVIASWLHPTWYPEIVTRVSCQNHADTLEESPWMDVSFSNAVNSQ
jgi:hypothetical protein